MGVAAWLAAVILTAPAGAPAGQPASGPAPALYLTDTDIAFIRGRIDAGRDPWADEFRRLAERLAGLREKKALGPSLVLPKVPIRKDPPMFRSAGVLRPGRVERGERVGRDLANLLADGRLARDLALHYRLSDGAGEDSAAAAKRILGTWCRAISTRVPDQAVAMDVAVGLGALLYAADLLRPYAGFDADTRKRFGEWAVELAEGVRKQSTDHADYPGKSRGLYQALWARHLALAAGTLYGTLVLRSEAPLRRAAAELANWAIERDKRKRMPIPRILSTAFNVAKGPDGLPQGRPMRTILLAETAFALRPVLLMDEILRNAGRSDAHAVLGLGADGRAWAAVRRIGRFLCNDLHWPAAAARMPRDGRGRPTLPIVFAEATLFVPLTGAAGLDNDGGIGRLAHRVLRHNPRRRETSDGGLDARARLEPWVLGPVFLTHFRPPSTATRPAIDRAP